MNHNNVLTGIYLDSSFSYYKMGKSELKIKEVRPQDHGIFMCYVTNGYGTSSLQIVVEVTPSMLKMS